MFLDGYLPLYLVVACGHTARSICLPCNWSRFHRLFPCLAIRLLSPDVSDGSATLSKASPCGCLSVCIGRLLGLHLDLHKHVFYASLDRTLPWRVGGEMCGPPVGYKNTVRYTSILHLHLRSS